MKLKCLTCAKTVSTSYDADRSRGDVLGRPWYVDETGLKHLAIVCLYCGTIHDCSGSMLRALLTGFKRPVNIHGSISPLELSAMIMARSQHPEASRQVAVQELGIPEAVIDVLLERNILGQAFSE